MPDRIARALAHAEARLAEADDLADSLAYVLSSCQDVMDVDAVGVMVRSRNGRLQLLAASSHQSAELELHQSQVDEGPCVDAADQDRSIAVSGEGAVRETWTTFGPAMLDAGYLAVHSAPLRAGGSTIGAMALFRRHELPFDQPEDVAAQAYADLVARVVVRGQDPDTGDVQSLVDAALSTRVGIERAKGVLAEVADVDMAEAYEMLRREAAESGRSLTATADEVVSRSMRRSTRGDAR